MTFGNDADLLKAIRVARPHVVVHTACAYGRDGETPLQVLDANLRLGLMLLQASLAGTKHLVTLMNAATVLDPTVSLYALSKQQFSEWGARLAKAHPAQLRFVDLRLQHMYGPGDAHSKFTTNVLHACQGNQPRLALTAGEQRRDFVHIDDVVTAFDTVLQHAASLGTVDCVDIGSGYAPSVREFVETVHRLAGSSTALDFGAVDYRPDEAMLCVANTSRLRAMGWSPQHDLVSGLRDTLRKEFNK
jgi:nucleoside-diphosphate-sugar epimerase